MYTATSDSGQICIRCFRLSTRCAEAALSIDFLGIKWPICAQNVAFESLHHPVEGRAASASMGVCDVQTPATNRLIYPRYS